MSRNPVSFDSEDRATIRGWMTDAALETAALAITANWRGVKSASEDLDTSNPVPAGTGDPAAGAYWLHRYSAEPEPSLGGELLSGLPAVLDVWLVHQPQLTGVDPEAFTDSLVEAIRSHVATSAAAADVPYTVGIPAAYTADLGTWRRKRIMARLWT